MTMPKKYRRKSGEVEAIQVIYGVTPVSDVADFMGLSNLQRNLYELRYICNDTDFIVKREGENGCVSVMGAEAFKARYEEFHEPSKDSRLIQHIMQHYGYTVEEVTDAIADDNVRSAMLALFNHKEEREREATKEPTKEPNITFNITMSTIREDADIEKIVNEINNQLKESLKSNQSFH